MFETDIGFVASFTQNKDPNSYSLISAGDSITTTSEHLSRITKANLCSGSVCPTDTYTFSFASTLLKDTLPFEKNKWIETACPTFSTARSSETYYLYSECAYYDVLEYYFNSTKTDTPLRPYGDRGMPDDVGYCPEKVAYLRPPSSSNLFDICFPHEYRDTTSFVLSADDNDYRRYTLETDVAATRYELVEDTVKKTMTW